MNQLEQLQNENSAFEYIKHIKWDNHWLHSAEERIQELTDSKKLF